MNVDHGSLPVRSCIVYGVAKTTKAAWNGRHAVHRAHSQSGRTGFEFDTRFEMKEVLA